MRPLGFLLLVSLAAATACGPVDPVATRNERILDPDYVPYYQLLGEEHLSRRNYRRAWTEFAALGDASALRRVLLAYAQDADAFRAATFSSMLAEYAKGYRSQYDVDEPLKPLAERLDEISARHVQAGGPEQARAAWGIRRAYIDNLDDVAERARYFPSLEKLQQELSRSARPDVARFGREQCASELAAVRADHRW